MLICFTKESEGKKKKPCMSSNDHLYLGRFCASFCLLGSFFQNLQTQIILIAVSSRINPTKQCKPVVKL